MKNLTSVPCSLLLLVGLVQAQAPAPGDARSVFEQYQSRERAFDSTVADLYCDTALIRNVRTYPDGRQRSLELPATQYKVLVRTSMPLAKSKGDYSTYSDVVFTPEGENVRIIATRFSVAKQYSSPISLLVGSCSSGYGILEELSQSRP